MKNVQILGVMIIMLLMCYGCRSKKLSSLNTTRSVSNGEVLINSLNEGNEKYLSKTSLADSVRHDYKLTIFTLDTFQFSLDKGYKGKAMKLEISGNMEQVTRIKDSVTFDAARKSELDARQLNREVTKQNIRIKSMEKTWINWWLIGSLIVFGLVILAFQRFKRYLT